MTSAFFAPALVAALVANGSAAIAPGEAFPSLAGEYLSGRKAVLPDAAKGRVALVLLGFTYDARFPVEAWAGRFRKQFEPDPRVTFYEIPMIGGIARLGSWFIDSGMRRGTPKADYEHVITVYRDTGPWKQRVGFEVPDAAYLVLLDRNGKVAWLHAGKFETAAYEALTAKVSELLATEQ